MNLHEFQAKALFSHYQIPVPQGRVASSAAEALALARQLGGDEWLVKAQVHAGGRGKGGGVRRVKGERELQETVARMIGARLVTHQTTVEGLPIRQVLIEPLCSIARELYLGAVIDRSRARVTFMASSMGGMDIEEVAAQQPGKIMSVSVDPIVGLQPYQCRKIGFALGLEAKQVGALSDIMQGLYRLFTDKDLSLVEINPLVVTQAGQLLAIDAKVVVDDNALYRHDELLALRDESQEDEKENKAQKFGLNYISLDGNIACMVNGAGLAMATMDLIKLHGGDPANFLDVGGGTTAERVAEAFKLILSDKKVKVILVNIFGGIVRCDLIAEGIIKAVQEVGITIPVVVRLEGTNVERGKELLRHSGVSIIAADDLTDAGVKAVRAAGGK